MISNNLYMLRYAWTYGKSYILFEVIARIVEIGPSVVFNTVGMKFILDGLTDKNIRLVMWALAGYAIVSLPLLCVNGWRQWSYNPKVNNAINAGIHRDLMSKASQLDMRWFDDPEFHNTHRRALNEAERRAQGVTQSVVDFAQSAASVGALLSVMIWLDSTVIMIALVSIAGQTVASTLHNKTHYEWSMAITKNGRIRGYIQRLFYDVRYAKELRILHNLKGLLFQKFTQCVEQFNDLVAKYAGKLAILSILRQTTDMSFILVTMAYLSIQVYQGDLSIGDFAALFAAVTHFRSSLSGLFGGLSSLYGHSLYVENLRRVIDCQPYIDTAEDDGMAISPGEPHSIEFRDVWFTYPGGKDPVLKGVSFQIEAGQSVALVGYNGAGKSTIVKLLTRLYDPNRGQILVDGHDIRSYSVRALRDIYTVIFQDFQAYAFSVGENVILRESRGDEDEQCIWNSLRIAGLEAKVQKLPKGTNTPVSRQFEDDGIELSGGETQKLILARVFAQKAGTVILDEPCSALDPLSEHAMYENLRQLRSANTTIIMISHRLSTTREADQILLLDDGYLAEKGTHLELLARNGKYARLFALQAEKYAV